MYADSRVRTPNIAKAARAPGHHLHFDPGRFALVAALPRQHSERLHAACERHPGRQEQAQSRHAHGQRHPGQGWHRDGLRGRRLVRHEPPEASFDLERISHAQCGGQRWRLLGRGQTDSCLRRQAGGQTLLRLGRGLRGPHAVHLSSGHHRALLRGPHGSGHRHPPRRNRF